MVAESSSEVDGKPSSPRLRCCKGLIWGHPEKESQELTSRNIPTSAETVFGPSWRSPPGLWLVRGQW